MVAAQHSRYKSPCCVIHRVRPLSASQSGDAFSFLDWPSRASLWQESAWQAWCSHPDTACAGGAQPDPVGGVTPAQWPGLGHRRWSWAGRGCCGGSQTLLRGPLPHWWCSAAPAGGEQAKTEPLRIRQCWRRKPQPSHHMACNVQYKHIRTGGPRLITWLPNVFVRLFVSWAD